MPITLRVIELSIVTGNIFEQNTVKPVLNVIQKEYQIIGFQNRLSLNAGQKYCRMLQGEHSAIL